MFKSGVLGAVCAVGFGVTALAEDVAVAVRVPARAAYSWTSVYVGAHAGYAGGMKDWTNSRFDFEIEGPIAGGQLGVNQQVGNWVIGLEADASWADIKGDQTVALGTAVSRQVARASSRIESMATLAGRLGFAQDRWLVYAKLGAAWAHETHAFVAVETFGVLTISRASISGSEDRFGAVFGLGAEYAFLGNWSARFEYDYIPFARRSVRLTGTQTDFGVTTAAVVGANILQTLHLVKLGVNYRFDTPGVQPIIAPARPAPGFDWSGAYLGAQAGYGFGRKNWTVAAPGGRFDAKGWLAGGTVGVNAQAGAFVGGAEAEWLGADVKGDQTFATLTLPTTTAGLSSRIDWIAMASLRLGFVAADRWLVYGKGGVALASERHSLSAAQVINPFASTTAIAAGAALHTGLHAGGGIEYAFLGNWSAKLEYNYVRMHNQDVVFTGTQTSLGTSSDVASRTSINQHLHLIKLGLNYHFGAHEDVIVARP